MSRRLDVLAPVMNPKMESPIIVEQPQGDMQLRMFRIEPSRTEYSVIFRSELRGALSSVA